MAKNLSISVGRKNRCLLSRHYLRKAPVAGAFLDSQMILFLFRIVLLIQSLLKLFQRKRAVEEITLHDITVILS